MVNQATPAVAKRFTRRVDFLEEPEIVDELQELAERRGHSLGAEIRHACRYWLQVNRPDDDDREKGW